MVKEKRRLTGALILLVGGVLLLQAGLARRVSVREKTELEPEEMPGSGGKAWVSPPDQGASGDLQEEKAYLRLRESDLLRDITIDGVIRLDNGEIQRTYGTGEIPADFCAT